VTNRRQFVRGSLVTSLSGLASGSLFVSQRHLVAEHSKVHAPPAVEFVRRVGASNLRLAPSTVFLPAKKVDLQEASNLLNGQVGLWLANTAQTDIAERVWNGNGPIRRYQDSQSLSKILAIASEAPQVFDVLYKNHDAEFHSKGSGWVWPSLLAAGGARPQ